LQQVRGHFVAPIPASSQTTCRAGRTLASCKPLQVQRSTGAMTVMKTFVLLLLWCLLWVLCWPLALLALVLWPLLWLLALPFRLVGITFHALFAFLRALLMLPARLLGGARRATVIA